MAIGLFIWTGCAADPSSGDDKKDPEPQTEAHEHEISTDWSYNDQSHWHSVLCEHQELVSGLAHTWGEAEIQTEPTCTWEGEQAISCTECGYTKTESIPAKGHTEVIVAGVEPTCEQSGRSDGVACSVCDQTLEWGSHLPSLSHDYTEQVVEPTCTERGYCLHTCSRCGDHYTDTYTSAVGHSFTEPTCTEGGVCTVCSATGDDARGHSWILASCTEPKTCQACRATEGVPNGHDWTEATCVTAKTCQRCRTTEGEPKGHDYVSEVIAPTCDHFGYTLHTCRACSFSTFDNETPSGCVYEEATCQAPATCHGCGSTRGDALPHVYVAGYCTVCKSLQSEGLTFESTSGGYRVKKLNGTGDWDIVIPDTYRDLPVVEIGDKAFYGTEITGVYIPASVTRIEDSAFEGCIYLETVTGGEGIEEIEARAFRSCSSLTDFTFREGLTSIGTSAFHDTAIRSVTIPSTIVTLSQSAFSSCSYLREIYYNAPALADFTESTAPFYQVGGSSSSTSIVLTVGANVSSIPAYLFYTSSESRANYVGRLVFEEGSICESIGDYAFKYCTSLSYVMLPGKLTSIGTGAFYGCTGMTEIDYDAVALEEYTGNGLRFYDAGTSGSGITVNVDAQVPRIPSHLFAGNYSLNSWEDFSAKIVSVHFEEGSICQSIGSYAFGYCSKLVTINVPASVTVVENNAFAGCDKLALAEYDNAYYISGTEKAFHVLISAKNKSITSCTISNSTVVIYGGAFNDCDQLSQVTFGSKVQYIGEYAFFGCLMIGALDLPDSLDYIATGAFQYCHGLTEVVIPDGVTYIGKSAFNYCLNLKNVTIGQKVQYIGSLSFDECPLKSVTFKDPGGWYYSNTSAGTPVDLSDPTTNATYLKEQISSYNLYRQ